MGDASSCWIWTACRSWINAGLSALVRLFKRVRGHGGRLGLAALQPPVRHVFELTRLERSFDVYPDVAEALRRPGR